jgi:hypothetical protein
MKLIQISLAESWQRFQSDTSPYFSLGKEDSTFAQVS